MNYFPENYDASRARFLKQVAVLQSKNKAAKLESISVGKENLTIDTVFIPALKSPRRLVIITSGNHGPEGYAGSALQALFMDEILLTLNLDETGILLIHALNPWGFKHHRRGTENNVNLNRNFDLSSELFKTPNDEYVRLEKFLEPTTPVQSSSAFPAKNLLFEMLSKREVTRKSLTEAIGKGQYHSKSGINFGGHDFEPQTKAITALLKRVASPYPSIFNIDLHTGLGKKGVLHVMTKKEINATSQEAQSKLFDTKKDAGFYELTPPEAEGFYEILGDYVNIIGKLFPEKNRVIIPITAEFGTMGNGLIGKTMTINRLILENQGFNHGYATREDEEAVKAKYLDLFYPQNDSWKNDVIRQGRYLLDTVVKRFISL